MPSCSAGVPPRGGILLYILQQPFELNYRLPSITVTTMTPTTQQPNQSSSAIMLYIATSLVFRVAMRHSTVCQPWVPLILRGDLPRSLCSSSSARCSSSYSSLFSIRIKSIRSATRPPSTTPSDSSFCHFIHLRTLSGLSMC